MRAKIINEKKINEESKGVVELSKFISNLREKTFPKLSDDELQDFMQGLKKWTLQMLGEKDDLSWQRPPEVRGDMDAKSWGDEDSGRDWRATQ